MSRYPSLKPRLFLILAALVMTPTRMMKRRSQKVRGENKSRKKVKSSLRSRPSLVPARKRTPTNCTFIKRKN